MQHQCALDRKKKYFHAICFEAHINNYKMKKNNHYRDVTFKTTVLITPDKTRLLTAQRSTPLFHRAV